MNLNILEKRFQMLDAKSNFLNYRFNPSSNKIDGIKKHAYYEELKDDYKSDLRLFGKDPFYTKPVDEKLILENHAKGDSL